MPGTKNEELGEGANIAQSVARVLHRSALLLTQSNLNAQIVGLIFVRVISRDFVDRALLAEDYDPRNHTKHHEQDDSSKVLDARVRSAAVSPASRPLLLKLLFFSFSLNEHSSKYFAGRRFGNLLNKLDKLDSLMRGDALLDKVH